MPASFFPRDRWFWIYHCGGLAAAGSLFAWRAVLLQQRPQLMVAAALASMSVTTLAALAFRWMIKRRGEAHESIATLARITLVVGIGGGIVGACAIHVARLPWTIRDVAPRFEAAGIRFSYVRWIANGILDDAPAQVLTLLAWCCIYLGVAASRRSRAAQIASLRLQSNFKEVWLSSLASQLNPHFLFNSLNNIRFMMYEDKGRAVAMIGALSEILRYSLDRGKEDKVGLLDEIAIVDKYLAIVRSQFEARLKVELDIAAGLDNVLVPPMILQLLVENAIKHGLDNLPAGGKVTLRAHQTEGRLVLHVLNDTPPRGMFPARGVGVGLRNIGERLRLLYDGSATLQTTHEGCQFSACLNLPLERRTPASSLL